MTIQRELLQQVEDLFARLAQAAADAPVLHRQVVEKAERDQAAAIAAAEIAYREETLAADAIHQAKAQEIEEEGRRRLAAVDGAHEQAMTTIRREYLAIAPAIVDRLAALESQHLLLAPWSQPGWQVWEPGGDGFMHLPTRLGRLVEASTWDRLAMPALLPLFGGQSVLCSAQAASMADIASAAQSFLLRLLASVPPGRLHFTFVDPLGLGQNAAAFMHLKDYDEALISGKAWTEPHQIEQQLAALTEHMENVIQSYLRNQFATIKDYNQFAGEIAEPYRVLVVFDFPANFSEAAARRLLSIAQNGPRCGVYALILADAGKPMPHGSSLADLIQVCTTIAWNGERWVWENPDLRDCQLDLDQPPPAELFNRIVNAVGAAATEAGRVEVPFERIAPAADRWWSGNSRGGLSAPLGPSGARKIQTVELGRGMTQHVLVAGKTGSGKSTLLHTLIISLALTYSPGEVALYLVDFKKGVEFKPYASYQLPHARVIAIESEREFGLSVLLGLDDELRRRGDLFRQAGVDSLSDFRDRVGQGLPRILLLVDEFQEFFSQDDAIASQAAQMLDRLVRQGRAFGIHVLLGSQTLAGAYSLARSTIDQMAVRIALQCSEADSRLILADDNPAARLLSRPGEAIYNAANGLIEGNNRFQVAWLPDSERDQYLRQVQILAAERGHHARQIVFEGNAPAVIVKNDLLTQMLEAPVWPPLQRRLSAWLGDPIAIKDPTAAFFRRQSGSNLLVVGQQEEEALGMLNAAIFSLAAQQAPAAARFYLLDFSPVDAPFADALAQVAASLPHAVVHGRRRQLSEVMAALAAEVDRRLAADEGDLAGEPSLYLLVFGLQRARDLRQEDDLDYSFTLSSEQTAAPSPAKQFPTLLREGPDLGVHTLLWCDTYANLTRTLDRRSLREFEMRVAMQMSAEDSNNLIDSPAAAKLGLHRAIFASAEEGRVEKFRPYGLPASAWLEHVSTQLRHKQEGSQ